MNSPLQYVVRAAEVQGGCHMISAVRGQKGRQTLPGLPSFTIAWPSGLPQIKGVASILSQDTAKAATHCSPA